MKRKNFLKLLLAAGMIALIIPTLLAVVLLSWVPDTHSWHTARPSQTDAPDFATWLARQQSTDSPSKELFIQFLGTSTLLVSDGETHLMTDGFFSRNTLLDVAISEIAPNPQEIHRVLQQHGIQQLDAVMVVHSHYDHAMDAPVVASYTGASLVGSPSTLNVGRGSGMAEEDMQPVVPGQPVRFGQFDVIFFQSRHVPLLPLVEELTGHGLPIDAPLVPPAPVSAWKEGDSYTVVLLHPGGNILIQGSAGFETGQLASLTQKMDLAFISVAGLAKQSHQYQQNYFSEVVSPGAPDTVIPIHWDNFFKPLAQNTPALPYLLDRVADGITLLQQHALSQQQEFVFLEPGDKLVYSGKDEK